MLVLQLSTHNNLQRYRQCLFFLTITSISRFTSASPFLHPIHASPAVKKMCCTGVVDAGITKTSATILLSSGIAIGGQPSTACTTSLALSKVVKQCSSSISPGGCFVLFLRVPSTYAELHSPGDEIVSLGEVDIHMRFLALEICAHQMKNHQPCP